jgi:outer membrane protein assembly factor BamB
MNRAVHLSVLITAALPLTFSTFAHAQNWPQWRGPNRDAKAVDFKAPDTWPKELTQKWLVNVGDGVATPALMGERLYVFTRQDTNEVVRCLEAATGNELWSDKYESKPADGYAKEFPARGPRLSLPTANLSHWEHLERSLVTMPSAAKDCGARTISTPGHSSTLPARQR